MARHRVIAMEHQPGAATQPPQGWCQSNARDNGCQKFNAGSNQFANLPPTSHDSSLSEPSSDDRIVRPPLTFRSVEWARAGVPVDTVSELRHDPEVALRGELAEVQDRGADRRSRL